MCEKIAPDCLMNWDKSSTETETENEDRVDANSPQASGLGSFQRRRNLYHASMQLKDAIAGIHMQTNWPPEAKHMTMEEVKKIVPPELYNFLAWMCGLSTEVGEQTESYVNVTPTSSSHKLFSICQDIISLGHREAVTTPKQYALGMAVRHMSGSSSLISLLSGLDHSMSHSFVLEHDTALANLQLSRGVIQEGFKKNLFTTIVWDNNDFGEETLSGKGTTHNTNGIIIQRQKQVADSDEVTCEQNEPQKRNKKRTLLVSRGPLAIYHATSKTGPNLPPESCKGLLQFLVASPFTHDNELDLMMVLSKMNSDGRILPSWTGFNVLLQKEKGTPPKSLIGYLPVIDGSPTELSTVNAVFQRSISIADQLDLSALVLVFDLAFYAKAQRVRWSNQSYITRTVLRLGEFHTLMSFF